MPSAETIAVISILVAAVVGLIAIQKTRRWLWVQGWRGWYRLKPDRALEDFRSLQPRVKVLAEQLAEGPIEPAALGELTEHLEALDVYPPAIRMRGPTSRLEREFSYLTTCMAPSKTVPLALQLARKNLAKGAQLTDTDWTNDALREFYRKLSDE